MNLKKNFRHKKLIVFDLDGTLAPTKSKVDAAMRALLHRLLAQKKVAIIGGGKYALFKSQLLQEFGCPKNLLERLFLFPTTSTSFYRYRRGWKKVYALELSGAEKKQIRRAFREALRLARWQKPKRTYGTVIEDRKTQITFSALGQDVVKVLGEKKGVALKEKWRKEYTPFKLRLAGALQKLLPRFAVRAAGHTSVDVTRKGIDKAYGLRQIEKHLKIPVREMLFLGDAIFPGGNDYAVVKTGVDLVKVRDPEETKEAIRFLLSESEHGILSA